MNRPAAAEDHTTLQGLLATIHLPSLLDHACLDPLQSSSALQEQVEAARFWECGGFCVPSGWVKRVRCRLPPSGPRLVAVVGFPTGAVPSSVKLAEAEWVAEAGADELDVVPDFAALADGDTEQVYGELAAIVQLGLPVKVITEAARLPTPLLETLVEAAMDAGAQWLKTGTGYGPGVTPEVVRRLVKLARKRAGVKASGGIHGLEQALRLLEAGAQRLGLSGAPALLEAARRGEIGTLR
ncbi:MAG: deoxyribose-phosphate aldolase [Synechococcus sp. SB0666_bin_14]|nr:deoxyribose-phosphate aldolase [Synechococcus sp. SB0666_bin_14]MYA91472.1 deoxyribose-phosphate aldolase [Synechococcus sp. SB0663_bin_10]MYG46290.1 deoxyribose-phosphate aldolase [Synechococcus sp. SB0675_bin_6]MYJ59917.1 deoxyribose-phosphate aldolase [Synechococcus sp. SB0672_bin_6]MYK91399.1 deoxyribose-phosphate aldolase [Synechococcus sp. SB0669_bin_8]